MVIKEIDRHISEYQKNLSRISFLEKRKADLENQLKQAESEMEEDSLRLTAMIDGQPHGSSISKPTESIAVDLVSGKVTWRVSQIQAEIQRVESELSRLVSEVGYVDAWMIVLTEKERIAFKLRLLQKESLPETIRLFGNAVGIYYSLNGMRQLVRKALEKIHGVAQEGA